MGWFWGASDDGKPKATSEDPLRNLDPSLREFLRKESPVKYSSSNPPPSTEQTTPPAAADPQSTATSKTKSNTRPDSPAAEQPKVPPQSLYQDGRYAHLWASYQPQAEAEAEAKSDAEKISDVIEGYKYRKAEIGRAALENCALEQWEVNECFRTGGVKARMTMCRAENRKFERCYLMQARFLKALGYLSAFDRPAEVDEKIQMHADTLYQRMIAQEEAIEAAKASGAPIPTFAPLLSNTKPSVPTSQTVLESEVAQRAAELKAAKSEELAPAVQKQLDERLKGLSGAERELEERAIAAELKAGEQVATQLDSIYQKQVDERNKRKAEGKQTIGDYVTNLFGTK